MTNPERTGDPKRELKNDPAVENGGISGSSDSPRDSHTSQPDGAPPAHELSPEEQMALYEENLKETDWGHQPC
jgi:hypothetical protein